MPQIKRVEIQIQSLFQLCVEYIGGNMHNFCKLSNNLIQTTDTEVSKNPFDVLPTIVLEPVVTNLSRKINETDDTDSHTYKGNKQKHFEMLLTPQLNTLDMMFFEIPEMFSCINLATFRCPLKYLNLSHMPLHCEDIVVHLCALKFEKLQTLNISWTSVGDRCLQIIGTYCRNLKELHVAYCKNITDAGMEGLCHSVDHFGKRLGPYKTIEVLNIDETKITKAGAQLALQNFRSLRSLIHCEVNLVNLLFEMHQHDFLNSKLNDVPKYFLASIYFSNDCEETYITGSLGLFASLCPLVTEVELTLYDEDNFNDGELLGLLNLKNLRRLSVNANVIITFDGGVFPLLRYFGRSLESLALGFFRETHQRINLRTVIENCPNLRKLKLEECEYYSMTYQPEETKSFSKRTKIELPIFNNLENLDYMGNQDDPGTSKMAIPSEILVSLFSSPLLKEICVLMCPSLTDDVFEKAFQVHQFKSLVSLSLSCCFSVTKRGIDVLMNNCNPLSSIQICSSNMLTKKNIQDLEKKSIMENWDLTIIIDYMDSSDSE